MRLPGDNEYRNSSLSMKYIVLGITLCLLLVLGVVVVTNRENEAKRKAALRQQQEQKVIALEHESAGAEEAGSNVEAAPNPVPADEAADSDTTTALEIDNTTTAMDRMSAENLPDSAATEEAQNRTTAGSLPEEAADAAEAAQNMEASVPESVPGEMSGAAGSVQSTEPSQPLTSMISGFNGRKSLADVERLYAEKKLVASDLDFWDMYPVNEPDILGAANGTEPEMRTADTSKNDETAAESAKPKDKYSRYDEEEKEKEKNDPSKDGKHTLITYADGEEEWVLINPYLEQNNYDFSKLSVKSNQILFYEDGRQSSYAGADLSKYNSQVDFTALKQAGIDYVMLRLGARGYETGQIMLDEKFTEYITAAVQAGLGIGVYFYSQAITEAEAVEEADFVIQQLANYQLTYPVAFDMEYIPNDSARIDGLNREEKTKIAKAFLEEIKKAGYKPMIYGTKEWLMKQIDLTKLTEYDVWLSQQEPTPDYPYRFQMWQYSLEGTIAGITGNVDLNISFVDYSAK